MQNKTTDKKAIYAEYMEKIFNQRKVELIDKYVADQYTLHDAPPHMEQGKKAIAQTIEMFKSAFPDFKITLEKILGEGDFVSARATFAGTHKGPIFGLKASGKKIKIRSFTMVSFNQNKIKESWVLNDLDSLRRQISEA